MAADLKTCEIVNLAVLTQGIIVTSDESLFTLYPEQIGMLSYTYVTLRYIDDSINFWAFVVSFYILEKKSSIKRYRKTSKV